MHKSWSHTKQRRSIAKIQSNKVDRNSTANVRPKVRCIFCSTSVLDLKKAGAPGIGVICVRGFFVPWYRSSIMFVRTVCMACVCVIYLYVGMRELEYNVKVCLPNRGLVLQLIKDQLAIYFMTTLKFYGSSNLDFNNSAPASIFLFQVWCRGYRCIHWMTELCFDSFEGFISMRNTHPSRRKGAWTKYLLNVV